MKILQSENLSPTEEAGWQSVYLQISHWKSLKEDEWNIFEL